MDLSKIFVTKFKTIGLEVSDNAVRAVYLKRKGGKVKIKNAAKVDLPHGIIVHGEIKEKSKFLRALKKLKKKIRIHKPSVILSISDHPVFLTTVNLPRMNEAKLREYLVLNAPENLPYPKNEAYFGFEILKEYLTKNAQDIAVGAVKRSYLDSIIQLLKMAGYSVIAAEPNSTSLSHLIQLTNPTGIFVVVDVKVEDSLVAVIEDGHVIFSTILPTGVASLYGSLAELGFKEEESRQILTTGVSPKTEATDAVANFYTVLASEINRILRFKGGNALKIYYVTEILMPKFDEYLSKQTNVPVEELGLAFPFPKLNGARTKEFFTALGAAIRGVGDLHKDAALTLLPVAVSRLVERRRYSMAMAAVTRLLITSLIGVAVVFGATNVTLMLISRNFSEKITVGLSEEDKLQIEKANNLNKLLESMNILLEREKSWDKVISSIAASEVSGVRYTAINLDAAKSEIVLRVFAKTRQDLTNLEESLKKSDFLSSISVPAGCVEQPTDIQCALTIKVNEAKAKRQDG